MAITYLSLIMGEQVLKQIALRALKMVAARVAPLVWVLDGSDKLVLSLLGNRG